MSLECPSRPYPVFSSSTVAQTQKVNQARKVAKKISHDEQFKLFYGSNIYLHHPINFCDCLVTFGTYPSPARQTACTALNCAWIRKLQPETATATSHTKQIRLCRHQNLLLLESCRSLKSMAGCDLPSPIKDANATKKFNRREMEQLYHAYKNMLKNLGNNMNRASRVATKLLVDNVSPIRIRISDKVGA